MLDASTAKAAKHLTASMCFALTKIMSVYIEYSTGESLPTVQNHGADDQSIGTTINKEVSSSLYTSYLLWKCNGRGEGRNRHGLYGCFGL
jgi:hypothetical protein